MNDIKRKEEFSNKKNISFSILALSFALLLTQLFVQNHVTYEGSDSKNFMRFTPWLSDVKKLKLINSSIITPKDHLYQLQKKVYTLCMNGVQFGNEYDA